jgi:hypothetical protein
MILQLILSFKASLDTFLTFWGSFLQNCKIQNGIDLVLNLSKLISRKIRIAEKIANFYFLLSCRFLIFMHPKNIKVVKRAVHSQKVSMGSYDMNSEVKKRAFV